MIFPHCWVCRCCVEASGFYMLFVCYLLNKLIKEAICIFSMQRLGVILHFEKIIISYIHQVKLSHSNHCFLSIQTRTKYFIKIQILARYIFPQSKYTKLKISKGGINSSMIACGIVMTQLKLLLCLGDTYLREFWFFTKQYMRCIEEI
jgi:hypothetical protein